MNNSYIDESMIEVFVYETSQIIATLEQIIITSEKSESFDEESINEIFRCMHTIKGSSAMMMYNDMSILSHHLEDIFFVIREDSKVKYDFSLLVDLVLESIDYLKIELMKIKEGETPDGDQSDLLARISDYLSKIKKSDKKNVKPDNKEKQKYYIQPNKHESEFKYYRARIWFEKDSRMESIRAYTIVHNMVDIVDEVLYKPRDIIEKDDSAEEIRNNGFLLMAKSKNEESVIKRYLEKIVFLHKLEFEKVTSDNYNDFARSFDQQEICEEIKIPKTSKKFVEKKEIQDKNYGIKQNIISVNVEKLDTLMDMVGEMVIAEAMVTQNPDVKNLGIESFDKASRHLHKITNELQDMVMAIRMVPLSTTFMKMHRVVRDMKRKLGKQVELEVYGEETEVDKNIIEKIADPLMHIIRNAIDHGIESEEQRLEKGKQAEGTIILEAKNSGSDVLLTIKDDGKGLDKNKLYEKAKLHGLVNKPFNEMSDRELYHLILSPGFSTNDKVTEFSGRGVGMDVVTKNIESVGGTVIVDSVADAGTTIVLKIPLTLAIIEGMNLRVGDSRFTLPIIAIKESFRPKNKEIFKDTEGHEMIMVRGQCYPIVRLYELFNVENAELNFEEGILIMVEEDERSRCIFADELLGQQQVVVKTMPDYVKKYKHIKGLSGCTLLGDGNISLILDVGGLNLSDVKNKK